MIFLFQKIKIHLKGQLFKDTWAVQKVNDVIFFCGN